MPRVLLALLVAMSLLATSLVSGGGASAFAAQAVTVGGKAIVSNTGGDPIRIRVDAGTQYAQVAVAYQGQSVTVLAGPKSDNVSKTWFKVQAPGGTGWMSADFLTVSGTPSTVTKLTGTAVVANTGADPLRMRAVASPSGQVITLLNPGATVTILAGPLTDVSGTTWYSVSAKGYSGWVMAQYLAPAQVAADVTANKEAVTQAKPVVQAQPAVVEAKPAVVVKPAVVAVVATAVPTQKPVVVVVQPKVTPTAAPQTKSVASGPGQYRQWMEEARALYPYKQSVDKMWSVMNCESGGNSRASNGGRYLGLFQYAPGTWGGSWNPYRGNSIWDARSQIFATAKAWSIGMQGAWSCYYITAGR